jgi:hypothetical protein
MNAHEFARIETQLCVLHRLANEVRESTRAQTEVVPVGLDPIDVRDGNEVVGISAVGDKARDAARVSAARSTAFRIAIARSARA